MGRLALDDMLAQGVDFERALAWHLQSNHFPPIPEVFDAAVLAINEARYDNWDGLIPLPEGVTWRDQDKAPVWACVEGWHLESFIEVEAYDEDDAYCEEHGHQPGCPHDPTDWDAIEKERYL